MDVAKNRSLISTGDLVIAIHGNSETDINKANTMKILVTEEAEN